MTMNGNMPITGYYQMPTIYETLPGGVIRAWDIGSKLLESERTIFLDSDFNDQMASAIVKQLMYLQGLNAKKEIKIYVNSPGGVVTSGLAIYDTIQNLSCPVSTIVIGLAASCGSFIAMAGAKGRRFAMPNAEIMTHQPSGGAQGQATDILIRAEHIQRTKKKMTELYVKHCGGTFEDWTAMMERDKWHTAEDALKLGMIDKIITKVEETK